MKDKSLFLNRIRVRLMGWHKENDDGSDQWFENLESYTNCPELIEVIGEEGNE